MAHARDVWVHQSLTSMYTRMYCTRTKVKIDGAQYVWVYLESWIYGVNGVKDRKRVVSTHVELTHTKAHYSPLYTYMSGY